MIDVIEKEDGYYDAYGNWYSKKLVEGDEDYGQII